MSQAAAALERAKTGGKGEAAMAVEKVAVVMVGGSAVGSAVVARVVVEWEVEWMVDKQGVGVKEMVARVAVDKGVVARVMVVRKVAARVLEAVAEA